MNYDPKKKYTWTPEDQFVLSGEEFGATLNAVRAIIGTPEAQRILALSRANDVFEGIMKRSVEEGIILEVPEPGKEGTHLKLQK